MTEYAIPLSNRLDVLAPSVFGLVAVVNAAGVVVLQRVLYARLAAMGRTKVLAASYLLVGIGAARLIGPALATGLITTVGPAFLWWTCAVLGILGTFGALRITAALRERTGRA